MYITRIAGAYDMKLKPRIFQEGYLVSKNILPFKESPRSKFKPNYKSPYVVTKVLTTGALESIDGDSPHKLVNFGSVKLYYV